MYIESTHDLPIVGKSMKIWRQIFPFKYVHIGFVYCNLKKFICTWFLKNRVRTIKLDELGFRSSSNLVSSLQKSSLKYSKISSYTALNYTGLADARFLIGSKIMWDAGIYVVKTLSCMVFQWCCLCLIK